MHLSLVCLSVHLLAAKPAAAHKSIALLAPRVLAWLLLNPWTLAEALAGTLPVGAPSLELLGGLLRTSVVDKGVLWLEWLNSSTTMTLLFFWVVFLPAWCVPLVLFCWPSPLGTGK